MLGGSGACDPGISFGSLESRIPPLLTLAPPKPLPQDLRQVRTGTAALQDVLVES